MLTDDRFWMAMSGIMGFSFFGIANFTNLFVGSNAIAGILQLAINAFVFIVWTIAFMKSSGFKKFVAFFGVIVPVIMAIITTWRVLIPFINSFH